MTSSLYARGNAIIPAKATVSLVDKEGYLYKLDSAQQAVLVTSATDVPRGIIAAVRQDGLEISGAILGGAHGPMRVKVGTAITDLRKDVVLKADGTVGPDPGTGTARVIVGRPLELGAVDEQIAICPIYPVIAS